MQPQSSMPLCLCGCGAPVTKPSNRYIRSHNGYPPHVSHANGARSKAFYEATREARFWARVRKGDGCWEWTGARTRHGYGWVTIGGKPGRAHRWAYIFAVGPIPDGMHILHSCDNPPCCRPDHLHVGTHAENMIEMSQRGRAGRPIGEMSGKAKLTWPEVEDIRWRAARGEHRKAIAARYGIGTSTVDGIVSGARWPTRR